MVDQFLAVTGEMKFADTVQANVGDLAVRGSDRRVDRAERGGRGGHAGVARVLYNRAYKAVPLQLPRLDSTVNYWLSISGKERQGVRDLHQLRTAQPEEPVQHLRRRRVATGPISSPGKDALTGAMSAPASGNYYFLAIDTDGHTAFAATYHQFCLLTKEAKKNGVNIGTCNA